MSDTATETTTRETKREHGGRANLTSGDGKTVIAESVVAKIVGMAARDVSGVYSMGTGRAFGGIRERFGGSTAVTQGVAVEVGEREAAADLDLIVEYGVSIPELANGVRQNVIAEVEQMCGLEVTEVNITVDDVHLPEEKSEETPEKPRVS